MAKKSIGDREVLAGVRNRYRHWQSLWKHACRLKHLDAGDMVYLRLRLNEAQDAYMNIKGILDEEAKNASD